MLNEFLKVAYAKSVKQQEQEDFMALMQQLPVEELHKIAQTGEIKLAYCMPSTSDGGQMSWVEQFKGTPFMEQAIGLEQELLQAEMANQQRNQVESQRSQQSYSQMDQIRLKKRLLEIQKAKSEMGTLAQAGMPVSGSLPGEQGPDQGAGVPAGTDAVGMPAKEAGVKTRALGELYQRQKQVIAAYGAKKMTSKHAEVANAGRLLAQQDMAKAAHQNELLAVGDRAGRLMAKSAGLGTSLLRVAKQNPGMVAGGAIGAIHGLTSDRGGIGEAVTEGIGGAALGHAAQGLGGRLLEGGSIGEAAKGYGHQLKREGQIIGAHLPKVEGAEKTKMFQGKLPAYGAEQT